MDGMSVSKVKVKTWTDRGTWVLRAGGKMGRLWGQEKRVEERRGE